MSFLSNIIGDEGTRTIARLQKRVADINALESEYEAKSDEDIKKEIQEYRDNEKMSSEYLDEILPNVFAMVREASKRTSGKRHFDVQLLGGMVLHEGKITEMRTGEGKTLTATLPTALNALLGKGAHVVTVNDYLARRDAVWMGEIYDFLGLSVACINHDSSFLYDPTVKQDSKEDEKRDEIGSFHVVNEFLRPCSRVEAYAADITYGTNNEYGFDWLRDNLVLQKEELRQREYSFAIVDEVDSILIDEARTPLIISAPDDDAADLYKTFSGIAPKLTKDTDYVLDEKHRSVLVNDEGISKVEKLLGVDDIYSENGIRYVRHLEQALKAQALFQKDRHYVVKGDEIVIVDEFTGRLMPGRRWSEGLHQAVEAKEGVTIQKESRTLATITFQNYFKLYDKLSGMTGTAKTSEEEFLKVYNLEVAVVPTNMEMIRLDQSDKVFQTENGKFIAVAREVKARHDKGQPILLGTSSIEKNEVLSNYLKKEGVPHNVLNAKNHEREAEILAQAGSPGAVTVATNIAGRGVDIILGGNPPTDESSKKVRELGGLLVIGTERHEARRIDNQLRGRSGRQGDPGESQFYLSLEDDLLRIFAPDKIKNLMGRLGIPEDEPIEARLVSRSIGQAQEKIEGLHFDSRKHLLDYDNVMSKQRVSVYRMRRDMLEATDEEQDELVRDILGEFSKAVMDAHDDETEARKIIASLLSKEDKELIPPENMDMPEAFALVLADEYQMRLNKDKEGFMRNTRTLFMQIVDTLWRDHLEVMEYTRSSVGLRAYGQRDPLVEYKNEAVRLFRDFNSALVNLFVQNLFKIGTQQAMPTRAPRMMTNESKIVAEKILKKADGSKVGRNDPCPCGSGLKYKKCGLIDAKEHKKQ
ncbi:MAG: preprotein translocase subunit SecA [bacterium]|nr:preprotein translocase subunit SecA [bacterium]